MTTHLEPSGLSRGGVVGLLIILAAGVATGRLLSLERVNEPSVHRTEKDSSPRPMWPKTRPDPWPTFGSNDRSRWAAVRALVDDGTFVIGKRDRNLVLASSPLPLAASHPLENLTLAQAGFLARTRSDSGIVFEDGWQTVDKVLHPDSLEFYSTKPPLLSSLAAGGYATLKKLFGWSIVRDRWLVIPLIVLFLNVLPFCLYLFLLSRLAEPGASAEWSTNYLVGAAGFATMVTPFLITLNNHTVTTFSVVVALYCLRNILVKPDWPWFVVAGLSCGFAVANELPALAFGGLLGGFLLLRWPGKTLGGFAPSIAFPILLLVILNYIQLGEIRPAYSHYGSSWYEYEGSHWLVPKGMVKRGIDFAGRNGESKLAYAFHLLVGHHGWFSLTPIMLLALPGIALAWMRKEVPNGGIPTERTGSGSDFLRINASFTAALSAILLAFYLMRSDNYGGWSNGPRWFMWLTPFWLLAMVPCLNYLARSRWGRATAFSLLLASLMSMNYQYWNPWRHPWIYNWMEARGWISY